mmetsp:Transcript_27880/g.93812  ORF Transcript_27880/g.93812 Transcript_27880/m.93812 type:complete len:311 (+) Transcript_27880:1405-2337(+)
MPDVRRKGGRVGWPKAPRVRRVDAQAPRRARKRRLPRRRAQLWLSITAVSGTLRLVARSLTGGRASPAAGVCTPRACRGRTAAAGCTTCAPPPRPCRFCPCQWPRLAEPEPRRAGSPPSSARVCGRGRRASRAISARRRRCWRATRWPLRAWRRWSTSAFPGWRPRRARTSRAQSPGRWSGAGGRGLQRLIGTAAARRSVRRRALTCGSASPDSRRAPRGPRTFPKTPRPPLVGTPAACRARAASSWRTSRSSRRRTWAARCSCCTASARRIGTCPCGCRAARTASGRACLRRRSALLSSWRSAHSPSRP